MSGHSKWNNIKRKKEKTDGARAKVFTKIGREIAVAVKEGGGNPASNSKLAALIAKAKANSVPNDNIQRIIKRAEGGDKTEYEAITYEGYGPGGIAVMVETLTDNRNRTAANMRHYFDKFGGNLGQMGCVGFMFTQKGVIVVDLEDKDPDELMMDALDAGADDFDAGEDAAEVTTSPENFTAVCEALEKKGYKFISADVAQVPSTTTALSDPDQLVQMGKLLDALDEKHVPRAVTSSSPQARIRAYLEPLGLYHRFGRIVTAYDVPHGKPEPDIYLKGAEALGLAPEKCLALEDSPSGILSASRAGCLSVVIPDQDQPDADTLSRVYAKADSLADIIGLL